jgi:hypothetical protein
LRLNKSLRGIFNYAFQDVKYSNGDSYNFSPRHKVNIGLQARLSKTWEAFLGVHYVDAMHYDSGAMAIPLGSYTRVDAKLGYNFGSKARPWNIALVATNLFDDQHREYPLMTPSGQGQPEGTPQRRTFYLTIGGKF